MPRKYDLHTHSTASDGTLTPSKLVALAAAKGIDLLALTDHDTLKGLAAARTATAAGAVRVLPGVEISVTWGGRTVHIIGLGIEPRNATLRKGLAGLRAYRHRRAGEIAHRLAGAGVAGALEGAQAFANGRPIGRTHFARFLVRRGYAPNEREVFKHYLVKGKPGHVAGEWVGLGEAVEWIRAAGGQAVIAHPGRYRFPRTKLLRLIGQFKEPGGVGIEVVSSSHTRDENLLFARYARENHLLASVGSDFHGPQNPWAKLGETPPLPAFCTPIWADWGA